MSVLRRSYRATPSYSGGFARTVAQSKNPSLWNGLVGLWLPSLGPTGSTLYDVGLLRNHGTLMNFESQDWKTYGQGYALDFDGTNEYIEMGAISSSNPLSFANSDMTMTAWIRHDGFGDSYQRIIDKSDGVGGANGWSFFLGGENGITNRVGISINDAADWTTTNVTYSTGEWFHVAAIVTATDFSMYVNGQLKPGAFFSGSATQPPSSPANLRIGTWNHSIGREFNGGLRQLTLHSRALSHQEIQTLYTDDFALVRQKGVVIPNLLNSIPDMSVAVSENSQSTDSFSVTSIISLSNPIDSTWTLLAR